MRRVARSAARVLRALLPPLALALLPWLARADGWTTYRRAETYSCLLARHDTVWCGSLDGGLERFLPATGRFEPIQRRPGGLGSQLVSALAFDRSGRLWVGTQDAGISRLSADGAQWDQVSELDGLPAGAIRVLRALGDTLLIGTDSGLALWTGSEIGGTIPEGVNGSPFQSDVVNGLALRVTAADTSLWVGTAKGLYVNRRFPYDTLTRVPAFGASEILGVAWDGTTLMVVSGGSAFTYQPADSSWATASGSGTIRALTDVSGTILVASEDGVRRWTGSGWSAYAGAPGYQTCRLAENPACTGPAIPTLDAQGRLWVGNRSGLRGLADGTWTLHAPDAVVGNDIQNLALQDGRVYVATFADGVGRFDGAHWRNWPNGTCGGCSPDTSFVNTMYSFSLLVDRDGRKWMGFWGFEMAELDDSTEPPLILHPAVSDTVYAYWRHTCGWSSEYDARGGHWIGMDSPNVDDYPPIGIDYYDSTGTYVTTYRPANTSSMPTGQIRALYMDRARQKLWVGFRGNGLRVYDQSGYTPGGDLAPVTSSQLAPTLDVFGIAGTTDSVWVMSSSDLRRFAVSGTGQVSGSKTIPIIGSPAPRGGCHPLDVSPDGTVWVGTDKGLYAYRASSDTSGYSRTDYTTDNSPLAGDEVRAVRVDPSTGVVWVGTATGMSRFDPGWAAPPTPELPTLEARAYPNPAWQTAVGPGLRLAGNATSFHGHVYDLAGRELHGFDVAAGRVFWDGRDASGQLVRPGIYFVRVESGTHARTLRVVLLR
jgi:ligand-binding sensor domain-containing protein